MTKKERLLKVLRCEIPDRIPFSPNIGQWFEYRKANNLLSADLKDCEDEWDAMLKLDVDIFSRRCNFAKLKYPEEIETYRNGDEEMQVTESVIHTPYGDLISMDVYQRNLATSYTKKHYIQNFEKEYRAFKYYIENTSYEFDFEVYNCLERRVGDNGLIMVPVLQTPLKMLHNMAGQEGATYFLFDYEKELMELFDIHTQRVAEFTRQALKTNALVFIAMENLDSLFYPPIFVEKYCKDFFLKLADVIHSQEKYLFAHACGRTKALARVVKECDLDGLEGITQPPIGDFQLKEAKAIHPKFIVNGGMSAAEQEVSVNAEEVLKGYIRKLFDEMGKDRFIFSSSCQTSPRTSYENLLYFREYCWEFGQ